MDCLDEIVQEEEGLGPSSKLKENEGSDLAEKRMSLVNGLINQMTLDEVKHKLQLLKSSTNGNKSVIRRRLKGIMRKKIYKGLKLQLTDFETDYYCVIDFEATCEEVNPAHYQHEIIEFPAILVDAHTLNIDYQFHAYCKPRINPMLSEFCKKLTGISQETVNTARYFKEVLDEFQKWLEKSTGNNKTFTLVTDGPFDICRFLALQCKYDNLALPHWAKEWIDIKRTFRTFYKRMAHRFPTIEDMMHKLDIPHEGRLHSGLDDAKNVIKILCQLVEDGCIIEPNDCINNEH